MSIRTKLATGRVVWKRYKSHHDHGDKTCRDKTTTTQNVRNSFLKSVTCDQNGGCKKIELLQSVHSTHYKKQFSEFVNGATPFMSIHRKWATGREVWKRYKSSHDMSDFDKPCRWIQNQKPWTKNGGSKKIDSTNDRRSVKKLGS